MARKVALFAFNGEPTCFVHALLNALDMRQNSIDVTLVIEGTATRTLCSMSDPSAQNHSLYLEVTEQGLIDCVCQACSHKTGVLDEVRRLGLPLCSEMQGHPAMSRYVAEGYEIVAL